MDLGPSRMDPWSSTDSERVTLEIRLPVRERQFEPEQRDDPFLIRIDFHPGFRYFLDGVSLSLLHKDWIDGYKGVSSDRVRYFAAGPAVASPVRGGAVTILAPTSFSSRWKSGDAMMAFPAAARRRSTASSGRLKDVGSSFR